MQCNEAWTLSHDAHTFFFKLSKIPFPIWPLVRQKQGTFYSQIAKVISRSKVQSIVTLDQKKGQGTLYLQIPFSIKGSNQTRIKARNLVLSKHPFLPGPRNTVLLKNCFQSQAPLRQEPGPRNFIQVHKTFKLQALLDMNNHDSIVIRRTF